MDLILSRPNVFRTFSTEWRVKWVPAIIAYCKRLKKKEILKVITEHQTDSLGKKLAIYIVQGIIIMVSH